MTFAEALKDKVETLREEARCLHGEAWRKIDGGQELTLKAMELEAEADRVEAALIASAQQLPA